MKVFNGTAEITRRFRDRDAGDVAIVFVDNVYLTGEGRFVTVDDMEPADVVGPIIQRAIEEFLGAEYAGVDTYEHGTLRHVEDDLYEVVAEGRVDDWVAERVTEIEVEAVSRYANGREDLSWGELADIEHAEYLDAEEAAELARLRALIEEEV